MTTPATDTTTPDTALAVIERHRKEWREEFERKDDSAGRSYYRGGVTALDEIADELRATPTPDAWNADTSPFDPTKEPGVVYMGAEWYGIPPIGHVGRGDFRTYIQLLDDCYRIRRSDGFTDDVARIPRTMPDGTTRSHADVISILRANGWGGDDESV